MIRKSYRFRIYPDEMQEEFFCRTIGCCRLLYNLCLDQKKLELKRSMPRKLFAFDQINELPELKRHFPFFSEAPANSLQQAILDLHQAFANFFAGRARFPTFRIKGRNNSFRHPDPKHIKIECDRIFMPKSGWTRLVMHRPIVGTMKNVTVCGVAGDWFVSIQVEQEIAVVPDNGGDPIGMYLCGSRQIELSDSSSIGIPGISQKERKRIGNAQRRLTRRVLGSRNRTKARLRLARMQAKLARRRKDALHKATTTIVKNHGVVAIEDLRVRELTQRRRDSAVPPSGPSQARTHENWHLVDLSPRMIRTMLEYKAPWYGCTIIAVDTARPVAGRDTADTARNILTLAIGTTGGLPEMACGSSRTIGRKQEKDVREDGSSSPQSRR